jgi:hypothetical protein
MTYVGDVLRPTLVYLREWDGVESMDRVPGDLRLMAARKIRDLPDSSRQLGQVTFYCGSWYAEPVERRTR